ncbi:hypothetical protein, partial [Campylobacter coli]|uniref:hypothetical protein n=1 Tax=Campylobacter coli TaxID=195 RepID=UPI001E5EEF85
ILFRMLIVSCTSLQIVLCNSCQRSFAYQLFVARPCLFVSAVGAVRGGGYGSKRNSDISCKCCI